MNQLTGKYVNVVLSVEAGRGMDFLKNAIHVIGNFNGRILESDQIAAQENLLFNTELVWEVEKKDLRKIRSANQPLRVECITTDLHKRKERVGFALISLRSAQIIPLKSSDQIVNFKWQKLIGCQGDKKKCHPELYISLTVRDHLLNETTNSIETGPFISEEESNNEEPIDPLFPLKYFEDGYIQIGNDDTELAAFTLNLYVKEAVNLDALLPEVLVFRQNSEDKFFLSFKILGITIKTKPLKSELHNTLILNEKIVVKLLSVRNSLEEFFKTQTVIISFLCGQDKLGITQAELNCTFSRQVSKCYFKFPSSNGMVPFGTTEKSPIIEIETWLDIDERGIVEVEEEKVKTKTIFSNILTKPNCFGDQTNRDYILGKLEKIGLKAKSEIDSSIQEETLNPLITKSVDTVVKNIPLSPRQEDPLDVYQKYILRLSLKNILWKNPPKDTKLIFKFLHPKAASYVTIFTEVDNSLGKKITLNNLNINVLYISTRNKMKNLLNAWPPRLVLLDEKERSLSEEYELNTAFISEMTTDQDITIKTARSLEPFAKIKAYISIKACNFENLEENSLIILYPAVLDEIISAKEIHDIEKWKDKEKKRFEAEIDKIKEKELKKLQNEWELKKEQLEEQLKKGVTRCKKIQDELQNKVGVLKTEKCLISRRNNCNIYEEYFKDNWKKYSKENTKEIVELLSKCQRDNDFLKEIVNEQRRKLETVEKSTLTKNQTASLLQELKVLEQKFEVVQTAKTYFKEQWKWACEEIHEIRTEDIKSMQDQILQNKEELSQLDVNKFTIYEDIGNDVNLSRMYRS